ncbi:MAG: HipA domain-containing protein [Candidatus Eremiobacteraeota bacterium]|nr:HipA domain-containing protein [Candidatus Eremiobacteraeota bacterium]MBV9409720.1 HipA domain-containing protein [Candidatus Eremiobacteraeota bacterium]
MPGMLGVWLASRRVGTLTNLPGDDNLFVFDDAYLDDDAPPVLSQSFIAAGGRPVRRIPRTHRVAPPFFANLLPEEDALLRAIIARQYALNRTRDFPFLRTLGADLPGAIVLHDESAGSEPVAPDQSALDEGERPLRFSLAGVQAKFSASVVAGRLTIPVTGLGGTWIAKLPTNAWPRLPENEHAVMSLAAAIGLDVPALGLFDLDAMDGLPRELPALRADEPRRAYAIARFDRADGGRVHAEDFNQIADQPPAEKYDHKTSSWIANVVATLCPNDDVDEFVRRLVFGVCVGNSDMHLKNWSLIYPNGRDARLAPLYDFVCTRRYFPNGELALTIGGERAFERIDRAALRAFAERAEISVKRALVVAGETVAAVRDTWPRIAERIDDAELVAAVERNFAQVPLMSGR